MQCFVLHLDSCPVGIFSTLEEAKTEGARRSGDSGLVHIETPIAPSRMQGWRLDKAARVWVEAALPFDSA